MVSEEISGRAFSFSFCLFEINPAFSLLNCSFCVEKHANSFPGVKQTVCARCHCVIGTFTGEELAADLADSQKDFPLDDITEDCLILCDDCYKPFSIWMKWNNPTAFTGDQHE
jgi:hypothetical protein